MAVIVILAMVVAGIVVMNARSAMQHAEQSAAAAEIRILAPAVAAYGLDHRNFTGFTPDALEQEYGVSLDNATRSTLTVLPTSTGDYCIQIRDGGWYAARNGASAPIETSQQPICG